MTASVVEDRLLPLAVVADLLGETRDALWKWREREIGPPSFRLCGRVVYRESELNAWIAAQEAASRKGGTTATE